MFYDLVDFIVDRFDYIFKVNGNQMLIYSCAVGIFVVEAEIINLFFRNKKDKSSIIVKDINFYTLELSSLFSFTNSFIFVWWLAIIFNIISLPLVFIFQKDCLISELERNKTHHDNTVKNSYKHYRVNFIYIAISYILYFFIGVCVNRLFS